MRADEVGHRNRLTGTGACQVLTADDALLDEFFSLVASIAARMIDKGAKWDNNDGKITTGPEVSRP